MHLLLDTQPLLLWLSAPESLSPAAHAAVRDESNLVYVSAASVWEIAIKRSLGKLAAPDNLTQLLVENEFLELPVTVVHALGVERLPPLHRDPFDRLLASQATHEGLTLVTRDIELLKYPVPLLAA
jgi:PIN domain nuclease of toxin-antitoxin system